MQGRPAVARKRSKGLKQSDEILIFKQVLQVPFKYSAGPVVSKFLSTLRDDKKILGIKCSKCGTVYLPPRSTCAKCSVHMSDWVELSGRGTLETFTTVHYPEPVQPVPTPYIIGVVKLDGADTGLPHLIGEAEEKDLKIGMKLEAVFAEERKGHILDLKYFRPAK